jgi:hypothetical protein
MRKILIKFYTKNGEIRKYTSKGSTRKISLKISLVDFEKAYLKVSYGEKICSYGCICLFYNDGWYKTKADLLYMLKAFCEE